MNDELRQHEDTFFRLIRSLLTDVAIGKLGVTSSRANDLLHKLKHLEELRRPAQGARIEELEGALRDTLCELSSLAFQVGVRTGGSVHRAQIRARAALPERSDGEIYAAVSRLDMSPEEINSLNDEIDTALTSTDGGGK